MAKYCVNIDSLLYNYKVSCDPIEQDEEELILLEKWCTRLSKGEIDCAILLVDGNKRFLSKSVLENSIISIMKVE